MQTDGEEQKEFFEPRTIQHDMRTPYVSLTKRLLLRCQRERERLEAEKKTAQHKPNVIPHNIQTSTSTEGNEPPVLDPVDGTTISIAPHSKENVIKHDQRQEPGSLSSNIPVQKPRPPDPASAVSNPTSTAEIKPPPPPPWSSQIAPTSSVHRRHINGHLSNDLRVQLPPAPPLSREPVPESVMLTPTSTVRSPFAQTLNSHPPALPTGSNLVHPSPVKKVSLEDYFKRNRHSKAESQSISDKNASASPILQQTPLKAPAGLEGEPKPTATEGTAIIDTPMKEAYDTPVEGKGLKL